MTSTDKGRRGVRGPALAAAGLGLVGALMLLTPDSGQRSPAPGEAAPTLAQPAPAAPPSAAAPSPAPAAPPAETSRSAGPPPATSSPAGEEPSYAPGQEPWRPVVTGFATDFTQPTPDWSVRVVRWTSDYLAGEYTQMRPDRVPAAELCVIEVVAAGEGTVDAVAVYDTGFRLIMRAEDSIDGWKITKVEPTE